LPTGFGGVRANTKNVDGGKKRSERGEKRALRWSWERNNKNTPLSEKRKANLVCLAGSQKTLEKRKLRGSEAGGTAQQHNKKGRNRRKARPQETVVSSLRGD